MFSFHWLLIVNYLLGSDLHGRLERLKTANNNKTLWLRVYYTNQQQERPLLNKKSKSMRKPELHARGVVGHSLKSLHRASSSLSQVALHPVFLFWFWDIRSNLSQAELHPKFRSVCRMLSKRQAIAEPWSYSFTIILIDRVRVRVRARQMDPPAQSSRQRLPRQCRALHQLSDRRRHRGSQPWESDKNSK